MWRFDSSREHFTTGSDVFLPLESPTFAFSLSAIAVKASASPMARKEIVAPIIDFEDLIHEVRDRKIILDADLARIYGVTAKRLNEQVKRSKDVSLLISRFSSEQERALLYGANCDRIQTQHSFPPCGLHETQRLRSAKVHQRQGDEDAQKEITILESKLTPAQIAEGQKRARDFKPQ
jgi:hypothetical protein